MVGSDEWASWEGSHRGRGGRGGLYTGPTEGATVGGNPASPHLPRHVEYRAVLTGRKGLLPLMHMKVLEGSEGPAEASMGVWRKGR